MTEAVYDRDYNFRGSENHKKELKTPLYVEETKETLALRKGEDWESGGKIRSLKKRDLKRAFFTGVSMKRV